MKMIYLALREQVSAKMRKLYSTLLHHRDVELVNAGKKRKGAWLQNEWDGPTRDT